MKTYGDKLYYCNNLGTIELYQENDFYTPETLAGALVTTACAVDRTRTYQGKLHYEIIDEIPGTVGFNKDIEQLCLERAQEIVSIGKAIDVYWSGGIDSTTLLVALLMVVENQDQITVRFEPRAIDEYPLFYEKYIKKMNHEIMEVYYNRDRNGDKITVTGDLGNQLFAHTSIGDISNKDRPWKTIFENDEVHFNRFVIPARNGRSPSRKHFRALVNSQEVRNFVVEKMEYHITKAPFEIRTIFDYYWWIQFSLKWQEMVFKYMVNAHKFTSDEFNNLKQFYRTDDFQRWSIVNHDMKIKDSWTSFKYPLKEFIYKFNHDHDYLDNKGTVASARPENSNDPEVNTFFRRREAMREGEIFCAVDNQLNNITIPDINQDPNRMQHFKKDFSDHCIFLSDDEFPRIDE